MIFSAVLTVLLLGAVWAAVFLLEVPAWIAVVTTAALALAWIAVLLWRARRARQAAGEIERTLQSQADAHSAAVRPDQQAEIDALRAEFQKAIGALKGSKLGRGGRDALALLPWYVIIGPPGAGKSTALRASGLQFPYLSARGGGVRGVGGTRNCEWWLTNEAVLLDTAGRYTTEDEDRDEWLAFLDLLARTRPRKPVNGLLIAVSVGDLGGESEEGIVALAERIRERVDEVMARLQVVLPAYLLFTKCDLVPGFVESFADLRKQDRGQVWGFTVPLAAQAGAGDTFRERFGELVEVVRGRALARMADERSVAVRERIWQFPQQLEALAGNMALLVETLFAANVYQDTPVFRGVYLTSGTQEGRTLDRVLGAMADAFGIRPRLGDDAPPLDARSYFLRDVFQKIVFPDRQLAVRNARAVRRDALWRWGLAAAAAAAALLLFALPLRAYLLNRSLVRTTGALVAQAAAALDGAQQTPRLDVLDPLRERLALLRRYQEDGPPWSMRFGMYQGDALLPGARSLYASAARRLVIEPVFALEAEELEAFAKKYEGSQGLPGEGDYAASYDRLKLALLLSGPRGPAEPARMTEADRAWAARRVVERWTEGGSARDGAAAQRVAANAELFTQLLAEEPALALVRYEDLVRRVRVVLNRVPYTSLALQKLVRAAEPSGQAATLATLLGEPVSVLRCEARVRGAFTRPGYEQVVKKLLDDPDALLETWVLARDGSDADERLAEAARQLRTRYFEAYIDEWRRFLEAVQIDVPAAGGALPAFQELTRGEPPPLPRLLRAVAYHARLGGVAGAAEKAGEGLLKKMLQRKLGAGAGAATAAMASDPSARRELGPADVERAMAGLVSFAMPPEPLPGAVAGTPTQPASPRSMPVDQYQEQLAFIRDALQAARDGAPPGALVERVAAARTKVRSLIETAEVGWRPRLEALLWPPLEAASHASAAESASNASQGWCAAVLQPFQRTLAGRYPFRPEGDDAALSDVAEFYRPGGAVWGFYDQALRADVPRAGEGFQFAKQLGGASGYRPELLAFLERARDVTQVLFPGGAAEPKLQLSVRIRPTPGVAVVWFEVDGQRFDYRNGPEEWHRIAWPGPTRGAGASLRVRTAAGQEEVIQQEGEWGLFRLLEAGKAKGEAGNPAFSASWALPSLGASVTLDFRSDKSETPFFGGHGAHARFLEPLRAALAPPAAIGREASACQ